MWADLDWRDMLVNGEAQSLDIAPFTKDDRTLLPVCFVAQSLGFEVEWIGSVQKVAIVYPLPNAD